nr:TIGR03960 family B12-binding radical SAM protein [Prochlorococcus sp. MIT 1300]
MSPTSKNQAFENHLSKPVAFEKLVDTGIHKPARYIGNELGVEPHNWDKATVRWALTYPELYEVGASNLGHIILYSILNSIPNQLCDRAYLPAADLSKRLRESKEKLFAVESRRPLIAFDILGFSLSYELGATNILEMLDLAQIALYSHQRGDLPLNDPNSPPLIFAGGPTATSNPEPYSAFFDFIALGDGEELLPEIGLIVSYSKKLKLSRSETLRELAHVPGVYVPSLYLLSKDGVTIIPKDDSLPKRILRRVATPMPKYAMGLVPNIETVHDRLTIEIRRGCTRGCRFCQPGMLTRPARDVDPDAVIDAVEEGMKKTGYSDFSLLSLSCSDYLSLPSVGVQLRNRLANKNVTLQLPSQRVDRFDDDIAHIVGGARQGSLTFAPEAGTQRLRDIVNKGLTDDELLKGIRKAMVNGFKKVKLYFMIGLPGENDSDVLGISETCKMLQQKCKDLGQLKLNITISNFTPKPHTPFQWHSVSTTEFERRQQILRQALRLLKGIKANFTDVRISAMEDFVGRGDRKLAPVIEAAWKAGAGMDSWFESLDKAYAAWNKAIKSANLEGQYRDIELGNWNSVKALKHEQLEQFCAQALPWDHIDSGVEKDWLSKDLQRAIQGSVIPDCSFGACSSCGVCGPELGHNEIIPPPPIPAKLKVKAPPSERACKIRLRFSKTGAMSFLSHLDMVRLFERALRRSNLPVSFTGGYHPLPRLQIALALPLGVQAFQELMDIEFTKYVDAHFVQTELQSKLPQGLVLQNAIKIPLKSKSLSQELDGALWNFNLEVETSHYPTALEWENAIKSILKSTQLIWKDKDKKGRPRERDCRSVLRSIQLNCFIDKNEQKNAYRGVNLQLDAQIDKLGRSLKPDHIRHWIGENLNQPIRVNDVKREKLRLIKC